jgi:hypothetical protein
MIKKAKKRTVKEFPLLKELSKYRTFMHEKGAHNYVDEHVYERCISCLGQTGSTDRMVILMELLASELITTSIEYRHGGVYDDVITDIDASSHPSYDNAMDAIEAGELCMKDCRIITKSGRIVNPNDSDEAMEEGKAVVQKLYDKFGAMGCNPNDEDSSIN